MPILNESCTIENKISSTTKVATFTCDNWKYMSLVSGTLAH